MHTIQCTPDVNTDVIVQLRRAFLTLSNAPTTTTTTQDSVRRKKFRKRQETFFHSETFQKAAVTFLSLFERAGMREMKAQYVAKSDKYIQDLPHQIPRWWTDTCL